jgi:hypothetical protein
MLESRMLLLNLAGILRLGLRSQRVTNGDRYLIVTIRAFRHGRYGFQLLNYFSLAGYRIVFFRSLGFLSTLTGYDRMVFNLPGVLLWRRRMAGKGRPYPWLQLGDVGMSSPPFEMSARFVIDLDYFRETTGECGFHLPYFIHPLLGRRLGKEERRHSGTRRRLLMYGQPDLPFDRARLEGHFGLVGRSEVFERLGSSHLPRYVPSDFQDLLRWLQQPAASHALCLIDSRKVWIPVDRWLEVLSAFDCFIATPGYCMPHAHNLMEAMAVGTVPILQYHRHLHPPLVPGRECLSFSGPDDLLHIVGQVLHMDDADIARLREGVLQYYSSHVDPCAVISRLFSLAAEGKANPVFFNAEELTMRLLDGRMSAAESAPAVGS